jgi:hypothetical protein
MDGWSTPRPGRFNPGKETRCPLYRGRGGLQGRSEREWKISPLPGIHPRIFQPVANRYIDRAIAAHLSAVTFWILHCPLQSLKINPRHTIGWNNPPTNNVRQNIRHKINVSCCVHLLMVKLNRLKYVKSLEIWAKDINEGDYNTYW